MGISLTLYVQPHGIDRADWAAAYDETLRLLRAHPGPLLGYFDRDVEGVAVPTYTLALAVDAGPLEQRRWHVVGDLASRRTAESFELYRDLRCHALPQRRTRGDVLLAVARREATVGTVFAAKTQGAPYHLAILAAAMVIESRFPRRALVSGDFDREDAERARAFAEQVLGHRVALPVRVDPPALVRRLAASCRGPARWRAFRRLLIWDSLADLRPLFRSLPRRAAAAWLAARLRGADPATRQHLLAAWLDTGGDLAALGRLACRAPHGPQWPPARLIRELAAIGLVDRDTPGPPLPLAVAEAFAARSGDERRDFRDVLAAMGGGLHRVHARFGRARIAAELGRAFGAAAPQLAAQLARAPGFRPALNPGATMIGALLALAPPTSTRTSTRGLFDRLVRATGPADLAPADRAAVRAVARAARRLPAGLPATARRQLASDAATARRVLARVVVATGRRLTEPAWDAIRAEPDPRVLAFLGALCMFDYEPQSLVAHALLENLALARFGAAPPGRAPRRAATP